MADDLNLHEGNKEDRSKNHHQVPNGHSYPPHDDQLPEHLNRYAEAVQDMHHDDALSHPSKTDSGAMHVNQDRVSIWIEAVGSTVLVSMASLVALSVMPIACGACPKPNVGA